MANIKHPRPQRVMHWINLLSLVVLGITGYLIYWPVNGLAIFAVRYVHFIVGTIFGINVLIRIYYAWAGHYADHGNFEMRGGRWGRLWPMIRHYLYLGSRPEEEGYNALQRLTYQGIALLALLQVLTGFSLAYPSGRLREVVSLLGGLGDVRALHLLLFFVFTAFLIVHPYLVLVEAPEEFAPMLLGEPEHPVGLGEKGPGVVS